MPSPTPRRTVRAGTAAHGSSHGRFVLPLSLSGLVALTRFRSSTSSRVSLPRLCHAMRRFPPAGPEGRGSPPSAVLSAHCDSRSRIPWAYWFAVRYRMHPASFVQSLARSRHRAGPTPGRGLDWSGWPVPLQPLRTRTEPGLPGSPAAHLAALQCSSDPGRPVAPRQSGASGAALAFTSTKAPALRISGFNSTASLPAVYASRRPLPDASCSSLWHLLSPTSPLPGLCLAQSEPRWRSPRSELRIWLQEPLAAQRRGSFFGTRWTAMQGFSSLWHLLSPTSPLPGLCLAQSEPRVAEFRVRNCESGGKSQRQRRGGGLSSARSRWRIEQQFRKCETTKIHCQSGRTNSVSICIPSFRAHLDHPDAGLLEMFCHQPGRFALVAAFNRQIDVRGFLPYHSGTLQITELDSVPFKPPLSALFSSRSAPGKRTFPSSRRRWRMLPAAFSLASRLMPT